jgi:hypothetical protein
MNLNLKIPRLNKNSILLLILVCALILCLVYIDNIMNWFNTRLNLINKTDDTFLNITGYDPLNGKLHNALFDNFKEGFQNTTNVSVFNDTSVDTVMNDTSNRNYKVVINPRNKSLKIEFEKVRESELDENIKEIGYLIILAKYNNRLEKIGHVDAKITNEGLYIENYINQYSNIFNKEEIKEYLRNMVRDIDNTTASKLKELDPFSNLSFSTSSSDANNTELTTAFFDLLELVYNNKFFNKALDVKPNSEYKTGIIDLYDDIKELEKTIEDLEINRTTKTEHANVNIEDEQFELIVQNRNDALNLKKKIDNLSNVNIDLIKFIQKFINKYSNLSLSNVSNNSSKGICNRDGICSYTFENLEDKDANGELYNYKLGFGFIYDKGVNTYVEELSQIYTYKFGVGSRMMYFKLDNSLEEQERLLKKLAEIERGAILSGNRTLQPMVKDDNNLDNTNIDAYMKMLTPYIGNYPDEFTLREQDVRDLSLADYLNKSVNRGTINIGVSIKDTPILPENNEDVEVSND